MGTLEIKSTFTCESRKLSTREKFHDNAREKMIMPVKKEKFNLLMVNFIKKVSKVVF